MTKELLEYFFSELQCFIALKKIKVNMCFKTYVANDNAYLL